MPYICIKRENDTIMKAFFISLITCLSISSGFCQNNQLTISKKGNGTKAIILISGLACKNEIWNQTVDSLSKQATVYSIDYYSGWMDSLITIEAIVFQIEHWIQSEQIEKSILIGHSLGGAIAMNLASKMPNLVEKLIILDTYPSISALSNPDFKVNQDNDCSAILSYFTGMTNDEFKKFQSVNLAQMISNVKKSNLLLSWLLNYNRKQYALLLCDYSNTDYRLLLKSIDCPALILVSSKMKPLELQIQAQYQELKSKKILFSDFGLHFLMFDDF